MSEWDCDNTLVDADFVLEDDADAESYVSYGEEEDFEEDGEEFTEEDYEEEDLVPAIPGIPMLARFTPPAPPKRGVGGIIRDPNAPVPKPMENCPIPFDGWDTTVTRDDEQQSEDGVQVISKKDAVSGGASNIAPSENLASGKGAQLIPNTAEDHAVQEPSGDIENSSSASSTVKSETDDNVQVDGEVELDAVKSDCASTADQELPEANENCTSQNDSNESKENEANKAVPDPNETSAIQNPDENASSQTDPSKCSGDEEQTENGASQDPDENGTSQNDSGEGSGDEELGETSADLSPQKIDAEADGLKDGLTEDNKSKKTEATGWTKIVTLLHAVFLVLCAVWLASVASPLRYNPKWGFPMLRRMDLSGQTAIVTGANRGI